MLKKSMILLLTILMLSSVTTWTAYAEGEIDSERIFAGEPAPFDGTIYTVAADSKINLMLTEGEDAMDALEAEVNKKPTIRLFWFGMGVLAAGAGAAAISR